MALFLNHFSCIGKVHLFGLLLLFFIAKCNGDVDSAELISQCLESVKDLSREVGNFKSVLGLQEDSTTGEQHCRYSSRFNQAELLLKLNHINREELEMKIDSENVKQRTKLESTLERIETVLNETVGMVNDLNESHLLELDSKLHRIEEVLNKNFASTNVRPQELHCKDEWVYFQESCYFFSTESGNWSQGREACQQIGGDYVKITTTQEFDFIAGHITANSFIGLKDNETENSFKWASDGTVDDNRHPTWWHRNQPSDSGGGEDCIHYWFHEGKTLWNDTNCNTKLRFICEMKHL